MSVILFYEPSRFLRSSGSGLFSAPRVRTKQAAFSLSAPQLRNKLPEDLQAYWCTEIQLQTTDRQVHAAVSPATAPRMRTAPQTEKLELTGLDPPLARKPQDTKRETCRGRRGSSNRESACLSACRRNHAGTQRRPLEDIRRQRRDIHKLEYINRHK
ncbi:hypothetical protein LDENG_00152500 [Lucifuga dentata]|nr:hypothetical protein LDENG_00152500 [Lucifuga dentata]